MPQARSSSGERSDTLAETVRVRTRSYGACPFEGSGLPRTPFKRDSREALAAIHQTGGAFVGRNDFVFSGL